MWSMLALSVLLFHQPAAGHYDRHVLGPDTPPAPWDPAIDATILNLDEADKYIQLAMPEAQDPEELAAESERHAAEWYAIDNYTLRTEKIAKTLDLSDCEVPPGYSLRYVRRDGSRKFCGFDLAARRFVHQTFAKNLNNTVAEAIIEACRKLVAAVQNRKVDEQKSLEQRAAERAMIAADWEDMRDFVLRESRIAQTLALYGCTVPLGYKIGFVRGRFMGWKTGRRPHVFVPNTSATRRNYTVDKAIVKVCRAIVAYASENV